MARVIFGPDELPSDFTALSRALTAAGIPEPFSTLANIGYGSLVLIERSTQMGERDKSCVDVTLKYEHILDGPNQELNRPASGLLFGKGRASITQKTTNFYYPYGQVNLGRVQILVAHTFPADYQGVAALTLDPTLPRTVIQGGEISIPFPQSNFQMQGVITTDNPVAVADQFIAKINSLTWMGKPPLTWICSEVQYDIIDIEGFVYRFAFEFQYNQDTWDATVIFNDQFLGRPPANVLPGTVVNPDSDSPETKATPPIRSYTENPISFNFQPAGYWNVPALGRQDFASLFAALFEGDQPQVG